MLETKLNDKSTVTRHGLFLGIERIDKHFFLSFKAIGKLTHADYEKITPLIDSALQGIKEADIKVLVDISELEGWELRAAWDDFKIGLKYGFDFSKIAIYGNQKWLEYSIKISSWFMSGEVKQFEDLENAMTWLNKKEVKKSIVQRDLASRESDIRDSLENLFKKNMKITDWNIAEADDQEASEILVDILSKKLDEIKIDVKNGKYKYY